MQDIFNLFEEIGLPYFRQGSMSNIEYPNSFFTFWNYDTPNLVFYDNDSRKYSERVQVCFYTNNPALIYSVINQLVDLAKENGFIVNGRPHDVPADKDNYYGRLINLDKIYKEE